MCDSNSHGRMCNVAHAEPAQEKSVIYRKKHVVVMGQFPQNSRTLYIPLIDGGDLAGRVPQSVQVGVFGRSLAASCEFDTGKLQHAARSPLLLLFPPRRKSEWRYIDLTQC